MRESIIPSEIAEPDVSTAAASLSSAAFRARFPPADCNAADPDWKAPDGRAIDEHVRDRMRRFQESLHPHTQADMSSGVFSAREASILLTSAYHRNTAPAVPTARDLLHVYGPDRDNVKDWTRFFRYAWKDKGPNGILYSSDEQIIREGKLACNSYAYSGQSSHALVGAGMLFQPQFGDAKVSIRPYVPWTTTASFTGTENSPASATAYLGIYVESWANSGGQHYVDRDHWIPVWSQNTQSFTSNITAGGAATVGDGLATEILAVTQRKYGIFVYAYLETSAGPQQGRNEQRFVTIDIDASVPFVVVEEALA
jgi:hypothetical protein